MKHRPLVLLVVCCVAAASALLLASRPAQGEIETLTIPEGYQSFTFELDPFGPAGAIRPGNWVDLIQVRAAAKGRGSEASTLFQNVSVLAVGDSPATLSVMLTPADAATLERAVKTGAIRVSLRSLWEGNTVVPLQKTTSPLPRRTRGP